MLEMAFWCMFLFVEASEIASRSAPGPEPRIALTTMPMISAGRLERVRAERRLLDFVWRLFVMVTL